MHWQDFVFTAGNIVFSAALIPSIVGKSKPALLTSLTTGVVLIVFAATYMTLSLTYSAVTSTVSGCLWLTLAIQKYRQMHS